MRLRRPGRADMPFLVAASGVWAGILGPRSVLWTALVVAGAVGAAGAWRHHRLWRWLAVGLVLGLGSGLLVGRRADLTVGHDIAPGPVVAEASALTDAVAGRFGSTVVVDAHRVVQGRLPAAPLVVSFRAGVEIEMGDRLRIVGRFDPHTSRIRRHLVAGRVVASDLEVIGGPSAPHLVAANHLRDHVQGSVDPASSESAALLAGFLIGDTSHLSDVSLDAMRRSGLTHFVAVSGSNVAMFLLLWWVLLSPLGLRGWARSIAGLAGIVVFATMTRWEPSVVRASSVAGLLLVGRAAGVPLSAWSALGAAVTGCLLVAGELATDVG